MHTTFIMNPFPIPPDWWLSHPSETYESQLGLLFPIYGKIIQMFQTTNQLEFEWVYSMNQDMFTNKSFPELVYREKPPGTPPYVKCIQKQWCPVYFPLHHSILGQWSFMLNASLLHTTWTSCAGSFGITSSKCIRYQSVNIWVHILYAFICSIFRVVKCIFKG